MFKKRAKRPGAQRDDSQLHAEASGDGDAEPAHKRKGAKSGPIDDSKFRIDREHHSTMTATVSSSDRNATVPTEIDKPVSRGLTDNSASDASGSTILYKGMQKEANPFGPMKAPANIRVVTRIDYQPDICKDYKETGYCGYGESCKFLHDRGDYKSGWQIDKEWEAEQAAKAKGGSGETENWEIHEEDEEKFPFACFICRKDFVDPVVTRCQHYFCQSCALTRHSKKSKKCAVCSTQTLGIFNTATQLIKRIAERDAQVGVEVDDQ